MDVGAVMDDLGDALSAIDGLRIYPYWADSIQPPAAIVEFPEALDYDRTLRRGSDDFSVPVVVMVARRDGRSSRDRLAKFAAGSGTDSVKAAIEAHTPTTYHSARVERVRFDTAQVAGVDYLAATFTVHLIGPGS